MRKRVDQTTSETVAMSGFKFLLLSELSIHGPYVPIRCWQYSTDDLKGASPSLAGTPQVHGRSRSAVERSL